MNFISLYPFPFGSYNDFLTIIAAALGCGLLIGLERERSQQRENQNSFAGLRSFAICALLGAVCFLFGPYFGIAGAFITGGIVIYSLKNQTDDPGVTTEIAFILTYFIGGMCIWNISFAAGLSVILTILLMTKHSMHGIAGKWITESEFKDGIFLLALLLIALPLTPNKALWGAVLNPYVILKLLTLILAVQALAHIAKRLLSSKNAMLLSSLASGFVSSTATIASLGLEVRNGRADAKANAGAALMSCVATLLQLMIIVIGVSITWFKLIVLPSLIAITILTIFALWFMRHTQPIENNQLTDSRMFSLKEAAIIAASLTLIQAGVYGLNLLLGDAGLIAGTLLASLFEIHSALATIVIQGEPSNHILSLAFVLGLAAHAIAKSINAFLSGGSRYALIFAPIQILHMTMFIIVFVWVLQY
ncbi:MULTISPECIES: MgtC/SapB family protein [unclassified Acinetobacter]|uniref:MgtC/SapB family protein n=1 Tax=unclassified Acinetobacter TaxID=196816 RepID=UPI0004D8A2D4|nr:MULTISPECIES: MgtC/SapB family protein [unclassified Acinetobacter]KEC85298.1 Mg2+ transporter-C, MgtC family protein [Acinetobacter sp. ETR1]WEE38214.1 MgtC/SapB family protein [Acinetobacter sp. TAC-1]